MLERKDYEDFGDLQTLSRMAGVTLQLLPRLLVKELVDNALDVLDKTDSKGECYVRLLDGNGFCVSDFGDGIEGSDEEIADLFSVRRHRRSSKLWRLPTRGALGNGLRVVAGAVLATGGDLTVATGGRVLRLTPTLHDGTTVERIASHTYPGTLIEVRLGGRLVVGEEALSWGRDAIVLAKQGGKRYSKNTSPHWYDIDTFYGLLLSAKGWTVRSFIEKFDDCTGKRAGRIANAFKNRRASDLNKTEAAQLLKTAQGIARTVTANHLGGVGRIEAFPAGYAILRTMMPLPASDVSVPVVIEAWSEPAEEADFTVFVNRTRVATETSANHHGTTVNLFGCGLLYKCHDVGKAPADIIINVETPCMPITSEGKLPDLKPIWDDLKRLIPKAVKDGNKAKRRSVKGAEKVTVAGIFRKHLAEAIDKAGAGGTYVFSQRRLYYALRPFILDAGLPEPTNNAFGKLITQHELRHGQIKGLYFDVRGILYHPHEEVEIPLGTLSVEKYERPKWTFNKILYIEKESLISILRANGWPERNDCALMSAKGFASRAARDVIDMIGETDEPIQFFCIHDGDASGTLIHQALQAGTDARPGRKVKVVNLGLDPWEGVAMGLDTEKVVRKKNKKGQLVQKPVADYIDEHGGDWREWLQSNRVELDAMATPQFIDWLDSKFAPYAGKLIPPAEVLSGQLRADVEAQLRQELIARILRENDLDGQVARGFREREGAIAGTVGRITGEVTSHLASRPTDLWKAPVQVIARAIVAKK